MKYSSRMRFMLKDLIDLRNNGWVGRREPEKAKKLSDIRKDGSEKSVQQSVKAPQDARQLNVEPDGWQAVSKKSAKAVPVKEVVKPITSSKSGGSYGALLIKEPRKSEKAKKKPSKDSRNKSEAVAVEDSANAQEVEDDDGGGESPEPAQDTNGKVEGPPGSNGQVDKDTLRKLMNAVDEFFTNDLYNEALLSFKEIVDPRGMGEVVKCLLVHVLEKKDEHRRKAAALLQHLFNDDFLTTEAASEGVMAFADVFDDLCIDVPKASDYAAVVIGSMISNDIIPLSVFCEIPEESNFTLCMKGPELIIRCLGELCSMEGGSTKAQSAYEGCSLYDLLLQRVMPDPGQQPAELLNELAAKFNVPFSLVVQ